MPDKDKDKQLQGAFGQKGTKANDMDYRHPHADKILKEIKAILSHSLWGQHFVQVSELHNVPVHILKAKLVAGFVPDSGAVYLSVSSKVDTAGPRQVIDFIKGVREGEQHQLGFTAPDKDKDLLNYAAILHAKHLDAIVHVCKVVHSLRETSYYQNLLDELNDLGHGMVYTAYMQQADEGEMFDAYVAADE